MELGRAEKIKQDYEFNHWLIQDHIEDVSDQESLLHPPFQANCVNWILGHIIKRRQDALRVLGSDVQLPGDFAHIYGTGSDPLNEAESAVPFSSLRQWLDQTQVELSQNLNQIEDPRLDRVVENDRGSKPMIEHLRGFHWHETYHIGQLDLLRAFIHSMR